MEFINQPINGQLGNLLVKLLQSPDFKTLNISVAFAKNSGVLRIKDFLSEFRNGGGKVNAFVGIDLEGTSYEALTALRLHTDTLTVVHSESSQQTFHPKIYYFSSDKGSQIIVGSHNLTGGGLWTNFESSIHVTVNPQNPSSEKLEKDIIDYFNKLSQLNESIMSINQQYDIDILLENGYIIKEVAEQARRAREAKENTSKHRLFKNSIPASKPKIPSLKKPSNIAPRNPAVASPTEQVNIVALPDVHNEQTIWFETRKMTGGSRNILDLSKKSLVTYGDPAGTPYELGENGFMRGAVTFFGLDPLNVKTQKNITINFEGVDYTNNTILFPTGDHANGTWRLQIKGVDENNLKITEAFRDMGGAHYLANKAITFTKIEDDYYYLSVFPETEIPNLEQASTLLAHNGETRQARKLGIL